MKRRYWRGTSTLHVGPCPIHSLPQPLVTIVTDHQSPKRHEQPDPDPIMLIPPQKGRTIHAIHALANKSWMESQVATTRNVNAPPLEEVHR